MKKILTLWVAACMGLTASAQFGTITPLHVKGNQLVDTHDNPVVLHGIMDTPSPYFNENRWGYACNDQTVQPCINYFDRIFSAITDTSQGAYCNLFRLHLDCCWTNDNSYNYEVAADQPAGTGGEANIKHFNPTRLKKYLGSLYYPIAQKAMKHGLYVIMRPPGVCPGNLQVGDYYQEYLMTVWDIVSQNANVRRSAGWLSIELANEPVNVRDANGNDSDRALHDYFQPIVDKIRANGFTGIIWVPGTGWQSNYRSYAKYPITGYNIGYAVHDYTGWYDCSDNHADANDLIKKFHEAVPVIDTNPIVITEIDWSPESEANGHYNEHGDWVNGNLGTWSTGTTSKWGMAYKALHDHYGNISMTLSGSHCYFDWKTFDQTQQVVPAFDANPEACAKACFDWYAEWANTKQPRPEYTRLWTADQGNGMFINPIINADAPDPDIIRVDDWYYMATTTFTYFPGTTIYKSRDLVNWEFCANPLERIADTDDYNLVNGKNHYSKGQWAPSLKYYKGKYYLNFIAYGDDGGDFMLTATNPEGKWEMKKVDGFYYDSGFLFDDDGKVYVAHGINHITVSQVDPSNSFKSTKNEEVIVRDDSGLEGCHMYRIGEYYYIYATYGGSDGSQTIFRASSPFGPYEEHEGLVFEGQKIHQGGLVETQTGEWWTILFRDAGSIGRVPYLEPVKWVDGWPVIGNNGKDVSTNSRSYKKPNVGQGWPQTYLPTNDAFCGSRLGLQWEWNHNPDNNAWKQTRGMLRLNTTGITDDLMQARNSLSQRILSYSPANTAGNKILDSYGTIKMAIDNMKDGDVAGLAVFQDPYALIGVKMENGVRRLYSLRCEYTEIDWSIGQEVTVSPVIQMGDAIESDTIYLRAVVNFGTNVAKFYYSLDNETWTKFGTDLTMRFSLKIFAGQRFLIFNYATQQNGGYVDIDWFSTEPTFTEELFFAPGTLTTIDPEDMEMATLEPDPTEMTIAIGQHKPIKFYAIGKSGYQRDVTELSTIRSSRATIASYENGEVVGNSVGKATISASFTDESGTMRIARCSVTVTAEDAIATANDKNASVVSTEFFTPEGRRLERPQGRLTIVRERLSNGCTRTKKLIK